MQELLESEEDKGGFCCVTMMECTDENDQDSTIRYTATDRHYALLRFDRSAGAIEFCPWCGSQLPPDLSNIKFKILQEEYGIEDPYNDDRDKLPPEFETDEWWRKRGL